MKNATLTASSQHAVPLHRQNPLISVLVWELRRFCANRLFWLQCLVFFVTMLFMLWLDLKPNTITMNTVSGFVAGTSAWGLLEYIPISLILLLGLLLPFINADGVTRDLQRRTNELVMTTVLPSWAYVWGRYITGLLMSLSLTMLMLAGILGIGIFFHLTIIDYPAPDIGNVLILWSGMIVPAAILLSSVSFALATRLPRQSTMIKISIMIAWLLGITILPRGLSDMTNPPAWYVALDPTSAVTVRSVLLQYDANFRSQTINLTSEVQFQHILLSIENQTPNLGTWLVPHLLIAGGSLLLIFITALTFNRFRQIIT